MTRRRVYVEACSVCGQAFDYEPPPGSRGPSRPRKTCGPECLQVARNANRRAQTGPKVTDEVLKRVHEQFPSTAREWDLEMVEVAWDRLSTLLPRKLNRRAAYLAKHGESPPVQ